MHELLCKAKEKLQHTSQQLREFPGQEPYRQQLQKWHLVSPAAGPSTGAHAGLQEKEYHLRATLPQSLPQNLPLLCMQR